MTAAIPLQIYSPFQLPPTMLDVTKLAGLLLTIRHQLESTDFNFSVKWID
jgi:hypothetical protein